MSKTMRGRTVLLLERECQAKVPVRKTLEAAGYTVWDAANGLRLISRLHVDRPDVVIMNTTRAWTDCFDLCQSLKSSDRFRGVRVVLLSDREDMDERAKNSCCDRLLSENGDPQELLAALEEVIDSPDDDCSALDLGN